ncbi:MAG: proteasome activator, partial [Actinomycetota bacterium]
SEAEMRVAQAQLVGWLEGLFHGIQAMLFAQQMEARARFDEMRRPSLPPGERQPPDPGQGTYL